MSNQFQTSIVIGIADGDDTEINVVLDYSIEKMQLPSYYRGDATYEAFITKAVDTDTDEEITGCLFKVISSDQRLLNSIVSEWREASTTDLQIRAELRRDDRRAA